MYTFHSHLCQMSTVCNKKEHFYQCNVQYTKYFTIIEHLSLYEINKFYSFLKVRLSFTPSQNTSMKLDLFSPKISNKMYRNIYIIYLMYIFLWLFLVSCLVNSFSSAPKLLKWICGLYICRKRLLSAMLLTSFGIIIAMLIRKHWIMLVLPILTNSVT